MSQRVLGDRYEVQEVLGRGGMATVWRGRDLRLDRPVAIKMLDGAALSDPATLTRFDREARTVARLAHPNIVSVFDFGDEDGVAYLVMELVEGRSLAAMLAGGPLDIRQAVAIAAQTCDALAAAHDAGVVHRDVKPGNILVTPGGVVKICDFGIARLQQAATQTNLTGPAVVMGTSDYLAPEQAAGGPVDARTDLYALGCVLYAMLTGAPPFAGDTPISVVSQHLHRQPDPVSSRRPDVPAGLDALVSQLLAKNPADRPADARQVRARLAALPESPTIAQAAASAVPRGTAAVVPPTRTLPVMAAGEDYPAAPGRRRAAFRLGPAGIAAVAVAAAVLTALALAALLTGRPSQQTGQGSGPSSATAGATGPTGQATASVPSDPVAALRQRIQELAASDRLDQDVVEDLLEDLEDVDQDLGRGNKAAERVDKLRERLDELRDDGEITPETYTSLTAGVEQLAQSLPGQGRRDN